MPTELIACLPVICPPDLPCLPTRLRTSLTGSYPAYCFASQPPCLPVCLCPCVLARLPVLQGTGRVARFELSPLEELGRPRVDVLANMSGIFRDR